MLKLHTFKLESAYAFEEYLIPKELEGEIDAPLIIPVGYLVRNTAPLGGKSVQLWVVSGRNISYQEWSYMLLNGIEADQFGPKFSYQTYTLGPKQVYPYFAMNGSNLEGPIRTQLFYRVLETTS